MPHNRTTPLLATPLVSLALLALTACGSPDAPSPTPAGSGDKTAAAHTSSVKVADTPLGRILVDDQGRTLYGFTKDKPGASKCSADCIAVWPALTSATGVKAGAGTDTALLKSTTLGQGAQQATYGGWPLYYYVGDVTAGDVNGQGLDSEWFAIDADGKLVKKTT